VTTGLAVAGLDTEKAERCLKSLLGKDIVLLELSHLSEPPDEVLKQVTDTVLPSA
jgi:hypothetical protein